MVHGDAATELGGDTAGEDGGVAFDDEIEIGAGEVEEKVTHEAADNEERDVKRCGDVRNAMQEVKALFGQGGGKLVGEIAAQFGTRGGGQAFEQIGAGDDADNVSIFGHRNLSPAVACHDPLKVFDGVGG